VLGTPVVPPVEAFGVGFISGARAAKLDAKVLSACHPGGLARGFDDPEWGKDAARLQMDQGADVIFAAGGKTGNGGLLAIAERGGSVLGIGVDADQYLTLPEARGILLSSATKLITPGVFKLIKAAQEGDFKGGNNTGDVALAPFHDLEPRVPADVKTKIQQATTDVLAGKIETGWSGRPSGNCPQP
jgi:basic membrane protein A